MTAKAITITIDLDAHELLRAEKRGDESFSHVIRRRLRPVKTARALLDAIPGCLMSEAALDGIEKVVQSRAGSSGESSKIDAEP